jgi:hypothetical protein
MRFLFLILFPLFSWAQSRPEGFIIQIDDRSMQVLSPEKKKEMFAVIVENRSLSDQIGKFTIGSKILKFVAVKSGQTTSVEIENKSTAPVVFIPVSPAFQEVPLYFGKKAYEIPSKE